VPGDMTRTHLSNPVSSDRPFASPATIGYSPSGGQGCPYSIPGFGRRPSRCDAANGDL
jgi:hypothetical protein